MTVQDEIKKNRENMARVINEFSTTVDRIRKDPMRSTLAKKTEADELLKQTQERAAKFYENEKNILAKAIDEQERNLFGYGSDTDTLLRRDADEKAFAFEFEDDALKAYKRAGQTQDATMQRSLALRAHESGWTSILKTHFVERPTEANALNDLVRLRAYRDDPGAQFMAATHYTVVPPADM